MTKSIFITATGTDVGKTYITGLIVKKMRDFGLNCGYYKPVLSGAERIGGDLVPGDCDYVVKKAGLDKNPEDCTSYIFERAVSPHLAAEIEHNPINLDKIKSDYIKISTEYDYLAVEGAGGIVCPFNLTQTRILLPDVVKALGLDVLIAADAALGTINHTVLTVEYAKLHGINVRGIILNKYDENDIMHCDNLQKIEELTQIPIITTVKKGEKDLKIDKNRLLEVWK